jgi:hypothetical protein
MFKQEIIIDEDITIIEIFYKKIYFIKIVLLIQNNKLKTI